MYITNFQDLAGTQIGDASNMTSDGRYILVRIDRYSVNGVPLGPNAGEINLPDRVLVDKYIDTNVRCVFHEGDFLNDGEFDIDWSHFEEMSANENIAHLANPDITSVAYRIVVDNALMVSPATNNLSLACVFTRRFDAAEYRQVPLLPEEELVCHGARPTFSWSMGEHLHRIPAADSQWYDRGLRQRSAPRAEHGPGGQVHLDRPDFRRRPDAQRAYPFRARQLHLARRDVQRQVQAQPVRQRLLGRRHVPHRCQRPAGRGR